MSPILNERLPHANPHDRPPEKVSLFTMIAHAEAELRLIRTCDKIGAARPRRTPSDGALLEKRQAAVVKALRLLGQVSDDELREFFQQKRAARAQAGEPGA